MTYPRQPPGYLYPDRNRSPTHGIDRPAARSGDARPPAWRSQQPSAWDLVQAYPDLRRAPDQYVHPASSADTTVLPAFGGPAQSPMIPDGGPQVPEEDRLSGADLARPRVLGYEIADDLFLLMLDDRSGRLRVHGDVVGAVLAAALLAELAAGDWIVVGDEALEPGPVAVRRERVPVDALAHLTLETILGRRELRGV